MTEMKRAKERKVAFGTLETMWW